MTRPDARLLVPVSALPGGRAPVGATVWLDDDSVTVCAGLVWANCRWSLDLSRPDVVDGVPVRLDALVWALGVLGVRPTSIVSRRYGDLDRYELSDPLFGAQGYIAREPWPRKIGRAFVLGDRWPDLTSLSDEDASRAVVAAALRGGA